MNFDAQNCEAWNGGGEEDDVPDCSHDACWQAWSDARQELVELGARQRRSW